MFNDFVVQPIFNLLVLIFNLIPGHNFGLAIIVFTIVVRTAMWPLVRKQLHQTRTMRKLQPELKRIKAEAKGDRQKESLMMMELYKERGVNPLGMFPVLIVQGIILFALYSGLHKVVVDPRQLYDFSYPFIQHFDFMQHLAKDKALFDDTLLGVVDLTKAAVSNSGVYWPAMIIVASSAVMQYFQSKQLMPSPKDGAKISDILRGAKEGKQADQTEVNDAIGQYMKFVFPFIIFIVTVNIASAISLYWLIGGAVAFFQQARALRDDTNEMEAIATQGAAADRADAAIESEVVKERPAAKKQSRRGKAVKRRKK